MTNESYMCAESVVQTWLFDTRSKNFWDMLGIKAYSRTLLGALFTSRKMRKLQYVINLEYLAILTSAMVKHKQQQGKKISCDEVRNIVIERAIYRNAYYYDMGLNEMKAAEEFATSVEYYNNSIASRYKINNRILSKISYNEDTIDGCAAMLEMYMIRHTYPRQK